MYLTQMLLDQEKSPDAGSTGDAEQISRGDRGVVSRPKAAQPLENRQPRWSEISPAPQRDAAGSHAGCGSVCAAGGALADKVV